MKFKVIILIIAAVFLFQSTSPWEGAAGVASNGDLPTSGFFIATNSFPRNTMVDITNIENGRSTRAIVANTLSNPGLLAIVSKDAAELIGMRPGSISRIRIVSPSDPIAYQRFTEGLAQEIPPFDSGNVKTEQELLNEVYGQDTFAQTTQTVIDDRPSPRSSEIGDPYFLEGEWGGVTRPEIVNIPRFDQEPAGPFNGQQTTQPAVQIEEPVTVVTTPVNGYNGTAEPVNGTNVVVVPEPVPVPVNGTNVVVTPEPVNANGNRLDVVKDVDEFIAEAVPSDIHKQAEPFDTELSRDTVAKDVPGITGEQSLDAIAKDIHRYTLEQLLEDIAKDIQRYTQEMDGVAPPVLVITNGEQSLDSVVKDVPEFSLGQGPDLVAKDVDRFVPERPQDDIAKVFQDFDTEMSLDEIASRFEGFNNVQSLDSIAKDVPEFSRGQGPDMVAKDVQRYAAEQSPEEIAKALQEFALERSPDEVAKAIQMYAPDLAGDDLVKALQVFFPDMTQDEITKALAGFAPERPLDVIAKDLTQFEQAAVVQTVPSEYIIVGTTERAPVEELYGIDPSLIIPGVETAQPKPPAAVTTVVTPAPAPAPAAAEPSFSIRTIPALDRGWYYVQLAALPVDLIENEIRKFDQQFFAYAPGVFKENNNLYSIMIGPLNQGESAAVLARFRSIGYRNAVVRRGT